MSLITRAGDLVYTFRFLKLLTTAFEDTNAYKLEIIDNEGKRIKTTRMDTPEKKSAYTAFHRLVFNVKKLMSKAPGGSSKLASYAAALFLIKEHYGVTEKNLEKILKENGIETLDLIEESSQWFLMKNKQLSPGIYRLVNEKLLTDTLDDRVMPKDKIRVDNNSFPVDEIFGVSIYKAQHLNTLQDVHFTIGEIYK